MSVSPEFTVHVSFFLIMDSKWMNMRIIYNMYNIVWRMYAIYKPIYLPVVPHKAVAEVSE